MTPSVLSINRQLFLVQNDTGFLRLYPDHYVYYISTQLGFRHCYILRAVIYTY